MRFGIVPSKMEVLLIVRDLDACTLGRIEKVDVYALLIYAAVIRQHGQQAGRFWVVVCQRKLYATVYASIIYVVDHVEGLF